MSISTPLLLTPPIVILGSDQGLGDSVSRRGGLLPRLQCHSFRGQCGECPSLNAATSTDNSPKHSGYEKPPRDSQRPGKHIILNAGECGAAIYIFREEALLLLLLDLSERRRSGFRCHFSFQSALDEATEPWGIKVERVEM